MGNTLESKRNSLLKSTSGSRSKKEVISISSQMAKRISSGLQTIENKLKIDCSSCTVDYLSKQSSNNIDNLEKAEAKQKTETSQYKECKRNAEMAQNQLKSAISAEESAKQRLKEAQLALDEAKKNVKIMKQKQSSTNSDLVDATTNLDKTSHNINKLVGKVRSDLYQRENQIVKKRKINLEQESYLHYQESELFAKQALELKQ